MHGAACKASLRERTASWKRCASGLHRQKHLPPARMRISRQRNSGWPTGAQQQAPLAVLQSSLVACHRKSGACRTEALGQAKARLTAAEGAVRKLTSEQNDLMQQLLVSLRHYHASPGEAHRRACCHF